MTPVAYKRNKSYADKALEDDRLKTLIESLQLAHKMGFSSPSSAIVEYLEASIDLLLRISLLLRRGVPGRRNNKEIIFLDDFQDELGNPKQISFRKKSDFYWEPEATKVLSLLTSFLVHLKDKTISTFPLYGKLLGISKEKLPAKASKVKQEKYIHKTRTNKRTKNYYRRQRQKKT